ncbi:hypothetical protein GCM10009080_46440 [Cupriavidus pauculus]|uniref:hypothetical protein n=1 Tax=Cupriavidus metallidurans TaxID=119219 RepID=UPI001D131845|nr:hypothetical protein [Cupriavidus metallidurans]
MFGLGDFNALGAFTGLLMAIMFWLDVNTLPMLAPFFLLACPCMAAQETLEPTVTAEMVSTDTPAMSMGALGTTNGAAKFISSAGVGLIWSALSPALAFALAPSPWRPARSGATTAHLNPA